MDSVTDLLKCQKQMWEASPVFDIYQSMISKWYQSDLQDEIEYLQDDISYDCIADKNSAYNGSFLQFPSAITRFFSFFLEVQRAIRSVSFFSYYFMNAIMSPNTAKRMPRSHMRITIFGSSHPLCCR